jgi:predicted transcriptional regulator
VIESPPRSLTLHLDDQADKALAVLKALASEPRLRILTLLGDRLLNVSEVAQALGIPLSTANLHLSTLERAGLILTDHKPAARGSQKVCARAFDAVTVQLPHSSQPSEQVLELSMPIGAYVDCQVAPTCGLASEHGIIGLFDDPASFYEPSRIEAQLLWFHHGYVEYRFPNRLPQGSVPEGLQLSLELCSEAPFHHDDWPSDITLWINGIEVGTWTSPADFGGQRGKLTPSWWEEHNSQYGLLKVWRVTPQGSWIDGLKLSQVTLADLKLEQVRYISVRLGVKETARHVGGINIFGRLFGNYPQDIALRIPYRLP